MGQVFHWANLACALAALGYWGVSVGGGLVTKRVLGLGTPLVGLGVKLIVFGSAVVVLYATGHRTLANVFANGALVPLGK